MANFKFPPNSEANRTWDREASTFWQEVAKPKSSSRELANSNKTLDSLWCEQSHNFWENLASQRKA